MIVVNKFYRRFLQRSEEEDGYVVNKIRLYAFIIFIINIGK